MGRLNMKTCEKIKILRTNHSMTQKELAEKLKVSESAVQKWEAGKNEVPPAVLGEIRDMFGITFDELMDESKEVERFIRLEDRTIKGESHKVFDANLPAFATIHRFYVPTKRPYSAIYVGSDEMLSCERGREAGMVSCWRSMHSRFDEVNLERVSPEKKVKTRAYDDDGIVKAILRLMEVLDELFFHEEMEIADRAKQSEGLVTYSAKDLHDEDIFGYAKKVEKLREHMRSLRPDLSRRMEAAMYSGRILAGYSRSRWDELDVVVDAKGEFDYIFELPYEGDRAYDGITGKSAKVVAEYLSNYLFAFHGIRRIEGCSLLSL